jgi:hypothetical protein
MNRAPEKSEFKPYVPEKTVAVVITKREAVLLTKLRRHAYGKILVHKANGLIIRAEITESQFIEEDAETNLD